MARLSQEFVEEHIDRYVKLYNKTPEAAGWFVDNFQMEESNEVKYKMKGFAQFLAIARIMGKAPEEIDMENLDPYELISKILGKRVVDYDWGRFEIARAPVENQTYPNRHYPAPSIDST